MVYFFTEDPCAHEGSNASHLLASVENELLGLYSAQLSFSSQAVVQRVKDALVGVCPVKGCEESFSAAHRTAFADHAQRAHSKIVW